MKPVANTLPVSGCASVYCCFTHRPIAYTQTTPAISSRKISKRAAPSAPPPPLQFNHSHSSSAPLKYIQRLRSRSREDLSVGGWGMAASLLLLLLILLSIVHLRTVRGSTKLIAPVSLTPLLETRLPRYSSLKWTHVGTVHCSRHQR